MMLPERAYLQFTPDLRICRLLNGLWQVSGSHGDVDSQQAIREMQAYHDAGFTTWDAADHYGPAEDFIGEFREQMPNENFQAFTKWVPRPAPVNRQLVEAAVNRSLQRLKTDKLDLLQFHWWEYRFPGYIEALQIMVKLRDEGKISYLGLTNFDTKHVQEITERGIRIVSNQVQYSIIDRRPEVQLVDFCIKHHIWLLTYGTVCGGLISERYLGQPEPQELSTASLRKYKTMIDTWGGWVLFQELLRVLKEIADYYGVSIANVATRYILDKPAVAGVILGARLSISQHRSDNARVFDFTLTQTDIAQIHAVTNRARNLFRAIGDCGDEYRR